MRVEIEQKNLWRQTVAAWNDSRVGAMFFLGFSAGIPLLLIFSILSVWLREAGVDRSEVTFFSWAALVYSFKFVWAPLVDHMPLPFLTRRLGRRRSWLLLAQLLVMAAISWMALVDPASHPGNLTTMACAAVLLGFSAATQDIVIDAYRIESVAPSMQALLASMYIAGYRIGMLVVGAGALLLVSHLATKPGGYDYQSWRLTYLAMASVMLIGVATTLCIREPLVERKDLYTYLPSQYSRLFFLFALSAACFAFTFLATGDGFEAMQDILRRQFPFLGHLTGFIVEAQRLLLAVVAGLTVTWIGVVMRFVDRTMIEMTYAAPVWDFFNRYHLRAALLVLTLIGFYRLSDVVLGVVANMFYIDMGYSKETIAYVSQTFGLAMTLLGGFFGGMLTLHFGVNSILLLGAFLSAITNLLFMFLAGAGNDTVLLAIVIAADNLSAGLATTAFVAFLSSLTNVSFTAVQYAIFSSTMTLIPKLIGGYSGSLVTAFGYKSFFLITAVMGIPVLGLILLVRMTVVAIPLGDS